LHHKHEERVRASQTRPSYEPLSASLARRRNECIERRDHTVIRLHSSSVRVLLNVAGWFAHRTLLSHFLSSFSAA
jgi:hypothetical protein